MTTVIRPALRYHGAKYRLAPWIMSFFPAHGCYVEAFGGAAGVLLQKERGYAEVYNDLDGAVVNFFKVLRDAESRARLIESVVLTPYAKAEFELAWKATDDPIEQARRLCRGTTLRTEVVWINPACAAALEREAPQLQMFA